MNKPLNSIIVCGPSGVGKGTLLQRLMKQFPSRFTFSVSHTTRAPREGEQNGREYHFVDRDTILQMRDRNEFLELCDVHGNFYGTSVAAVQAVQSAGRVCVIEIDVKGAQKLRDRTDDALNSVYLFITAPEEELKKRITRRGSEDSLMLEKRMSTARSEFSFYDSNPDFFNFTITNDDLDAAYGRLVAALDQEFTAHGMEGLQLS